MKITLREEEKEVFKKKYLNLVFETQEEYDSCLAMGDGKASVPKAVRDCRWHRVSETEPLEEMLKAIAHELEK